MQHVSLDELDRVPHFMGANTDRRPLSRAIDGMGFATTYLKLAPGESFSGGLHTHTDQEELFLVLSGTATWETKGAAGAEAEQFEVGPMEAVHFGEGDVYQTGRNESDGPVTGLAIGVGSPRHSWEGVEALVDCPTCEAETVHSLAAPDAVDRRMPEMEEMTITCTECGNEV